VEMAAELQPVHPVPGHPRMESGRAGAVE
jgi:hypothetical protein